MPRRSPPGSATYVPARALRSCSRISDAERAGLQAGDIVIAVGDEPVSSASELNRALDAVQTSAVLTVARRTAQVKLTVTRAAPAPAR